MGMDGGMGAMPVYNVGDNNDNGMGGNWIWIILLFFLVGGNGFGGNNTLNKADLCEGFNFNNLENGVRGIQNGLCDGFYAQNTTMLTGFNGIGNQIAESRFAAQQCCCETNRNIDSLRFQSEKNTCDITTAIHAEGEATRALITQNEIQKLRDELQAAQLTLGNAAQTTTIINAVRPTPIPAWPTCSPFQAQNFFNGGCCNPCGC